MKVAIDAMGGDYAPGEIVLGAIQAAKEYVNQNLEIILVGDQAQIIQALDHQGDWKSLRISVHHAGEVIDMHESPGAAVRKKGCLGSGCY